jgi:dephospho-CoA kinase
MRDQSHSISHYKNSMPQRRIGITGGIATGKTTIANYLAQTYQLPILDADIYAKDAVQINSPVLSQIVERYQNIQLADGTLNRQRLGEIIFGNPDERQWLEQQIHPYVRSRFESELKILIAVPRIVLVIPLLFEAGMTDLVTEVWVVSCSSEQQIRRLQARNRLTRQQALARINSQMPLSEKVAKADIILENSVSNPEILLEQIDLALRS